MDSISSAILISVEDSDQARAQRLQAELVASVDTTLRTQAPNTSVLSQTLTQDAGSNYVNYNSGISAGKAALVQKVIDTNGVDAAAFDKLAALSVEELNDLLEAGEKRIPVGKDAAAMAVDEYAGTTALNSPVTDVDPELEEGIYEVELKTAFGDFDYIVDAFTGKVLSGPKDVLNTPTTPPAAPDPAPEDSAPQIPSTQKPAVTTPSAADKDVGEAAAKRAALDNAGLSESDVTDWKIERDWDDGQLEYEVTFWCGTTEYDYTIHGHTGAVLKCGIDHHEEYGSGHHSDAHHSGSGTGGTAASADVGREAAKSAALAHAGVTESQTTNMKVERDWDDGRLEYEVEFYAGRTEYEYIIDGATGAVLEYEWDD